MNVKFFKTSKNIISRVESMGYPLILYFKSKYCSPCIAVERMLDEINISLFGNRLNVRKIDILNDVELAKKFNVLSVPTIIIGRTRLNVVIDKNELTDCILQGFLSSISFEDDPLVSASTTPSNDEKNTTAPSSEGTGSSPLPETASHEMKNSE